ncbi:MAG: hypothetical protein U0822_08525 [Anaerolineae bacterium]
MFVLRTTGPWWTKMAMPRDPSCDQAAGGRVVMVIAEFPPEL